MDQRAEVVKAEADYGKGNAHFEKALFERYQSEIREKLLPEFSSQGKELFERRQSLAEKKHKVESQLAQLMKEEYEVVKSQKEFLEKKLAELEKRLRRVRKPTDS